MARVVLILLLLASSALASPADSLTGVDMRKEHAARRQAVAELLGEGTLVLFPAPKRGYGDYRPESNLFWLTGVSSSQATLLMRIEFPEATNRARRARILADRLEDTVTAIGQVIRKGSRAGLKIDEVFRAEIAEATRARDQARELHRAERGPVRVTTRLYLPPGSVRARMWTGDLSVGPEAVRTTGVKDIRSLGQLPGDLAALSGPDARLFTLRDRYLSSYARDRLSSVRAFRRNAMDALRRGRSVKSAEEVARLRRACQLTAEGLIDTMKTARPGQFEYELQARLEFACRRGGARRQAFASIVGSGPNGVILHYSDNDRKTADGDLVLMDVGAEFMGYAADVTRTFPVNGKFTERQAKIYDVVLEAQRAGLAAVRPGATLRDVDSAARAIISKAGFGKRFPHSVGHYVGLDPHDPSPGGPFVPGVVITVEPGIYLPGEGVGIRIEDTVVVTKDGCDVLSKDVPKERAEIEKLMKR